MGPDKSWKGLRNGNTKIAAFLAKHFLLGETGAEVMHLSFEFGQN